MVSSGVEAAIHVAGVRCGPCGAMRWTVYTVQHTAPCSNVVHNTCAVVGILCRDYVSLYDRVTCG